MNTGLANKQIPILMYHSVSSCSATPLFKQFVVSPALFEEHMAFLYQHGYTPMTVTQLINAFAQATSTFPERPVVITFDDGFADFLTDALPILKQYSFPATLYVPTAFVGGTSRWLQRERETARPMLTWDQLIEVSKSGVECGAHSHSHPQLDMLPSSIAYDEIMICKQLLEGHLNMHVTSFAYPFGYYTKNVQKLVKAAGYTSACAVKHALSSVTTDRFALARRIVKANTDLDAFAALLSPRGSLTMATMYMRARTPVWKLVRLSSALVKRQLKREVVEA